MALFAIIQYRSITRCQHEVLYSRSGHEEPIRRIPGWDARKQSALRSCGGIKRHKAYTCGAERPLNPISQGHRKLNASLSIMHADFPYRNRGHAKAVSPTCFIEPPHARGPKPLGDALRIPKPNMRIEK
jgi:hypothetical protein